MSTLCVLPFSLKCKAQILTIASGWYMPWLPCISLLYLCPPFLTLLLPYCTLFSSSNLPITPASGFRSCSSLCVQSHSLSHSQNTLLCFLFSVLTFSNTLRYFPIYLKFGSAGKTPACNAGDPGSIPGWGRCPGEGNGNPLQYSCLGNSMDRGAL